MQLCFKRTSVLINTVHGRGHFKIKFREKCKWEGTLWLLHFNKASHVHPDSAFAMVHPICVSLTGPLGVQSCGQTLSGVFLGGCFWMSVMFRWVGWVKKMALPSVSGPHQSVEGLNTDQKGWPLPKEERIPPTWWPSNWDIGFFLTLDLNWSISPPWVWSLPVLE